LDTIKQILSSEDFKDTDKNYKDYYFVVGVHGGRGDGLVDQSSAHLSSHLYTRVRLEDLIGTNHNGTAKGNGILRFEWKRLPGFQVTGLDVYHLPQNQILVRTEGAAHMDKNSKAFPYLLAFVKKDFNKLKDLHRRHVRKLRQFMVELNLPESDRLTGYDFTLRPNSRDIALSGRFFNPSTNTIVWTGVFKSRKNFLDFKEMDPARSGRVILKGTKPFARTFEVELLVNPGANHFVEVVSAEESNKKFKLPLPSIYDFIPKNEFFRLMKGEK
jgi:hypothetical protein